MCGEGGLDVLWGCAGEATLYKEGYANINRKLIKSDRVPSEL